MSRMHEPESAAPSRFSMNDLRQRVREMGAYGLCTVAAFALDFPACLPPW